MSYIKGKYKQSIFESETGYKVGLFRVQETDDKELVTNKTITFTGYFGMLNKDDTYVFNGNVIYHDRYGMQFQVDTYEKVVPEGKDAIIDFLTSSFVKGCGEVLARKIYKTFGDYALTKIKESRENLFLVSGMTDKKADSIYKSVVKYFEADKEIVKLKEMGFTVKETMELMNNFGKRVLELIDKNIYVLRDYVDFPKLDSIFLVNNDPEDDRRVDAAIIRAMKDLTFELGDIYLDKIEIVEELASRYNIFKSIDENLRNLAKRKEIMIANEDYYLMTDYLDELNNGVSIASLMSRSTKKISKFNDLIKLTEGELGITYNKEQKEAIKSALTNNVSIITGGPGTGKTTIIKGILRLYSIYKKISYDSITREVCLLAPTGRASKRMSETCGIGASTIHRFLKWDKESNTFAVNELNKVHYNMFIIDETSMLDNHLLSSLFKGIDIHTKIIFVGDEYQLPSVGPGLILSDMISAGVPHIKLETIYRQSENSYIPMLAKDIKNVNVTDDYLDKKDDYNFISCDSKEIKNILVQIVEKMQDKKMDLGNLQVLAPMYKGENGIDNLNIVLQELINPKDKKKDEIKVGPITYRVGDKILNLVNDIDNNIYNGDIGYIKSIDINSKKEPIVVEYDNNEVGYKRENFNQITHAYAISIHKSQGSEFMHVIMPITKGYSRMLYNKLLYTGVSRAKKSLVLLGDKDAFIRCVNNSYSLVRKTNLKVKIMNNLKINTQNNK
ncbi:MAG: ATP-dependent RecD-like DNA helicase [Bacilli bacterium]